MYLYARLCAGLVVALHLVSPLVPVEHLWGNGGFAAIPLLARLLAAGLTCLFFLPGIAEATYGHALRAWHRCRVFMPSWALRACVAVLAFATFWVGRLRHLRWGDAYIFANAISHPEVRLTYNWQAPLDVFLHAKAWVLSHRLWQWDVQTTYALISCLAGVAFLLVLARLAEELGRDVSERLGAFALVATLGSMELFFGYVESYTIVPVGILLFLWLGLRYLRGKTALWLVSLTAAFTHAFSLSTLPLSAALMYLIWYGWRKRRDSLLRVLLEAGVPMVMVGAGVVGLMTAGGHGIDALRTYDAPGGGDHRWLVPLFRVETRWEHYTMFSWAHLRDFLNEQLLVAPMSLMLLVGVVSIHRRWLRQPDPAFFFLATAAAAYLLLTFVWNPDYGGRRDWDLFAPAAFPVTVMAAYVMNGYLERNERERVTALAVAVSLMHLIPWVHFNAQPWPWD